MGGVAALVCRHRAWLRGWEPSTPPAPARRAGCSRGLQPRTPLPGGSWRGG